MPWWVWSGEAGEESGVGTAWAKGIPGEGTEVGWFDSGPRSSQELNCRRTCPPWAPPSDDPILTLAFYLLSVRSEFSSSTLLAQ